MVHSFPAMQRLEPAGFARAGGWLTQAMAREPEYVPVCFIYALWQVLAIGQGWAEDEAGARARAEDAVNRGIALSPNSARGHAVAGLIKAKAGRASAEAMDLFDRALRCNPDLPMAWGFSAMACAWLGDFDEAARRHAEYLAILPRNMFGFLADAEIGTSLLLRGDNEAAASFGRARSQTVPLFSDGYKPWLSALGHLGQTREAETVLDRLLRIEPAFSVSRFLATTPLQDTGHREHFAEGLRRAGLR
jgi:tetratricopeptide (TPR) repeat protein